MKDFIRQNLVLVTGLVLPLLLILLFFVATVIPKWFGHPPQYKMLFTTERYQYQYAQDILLDFTVKDQKLFVKVIKNDEKNNNYNIRQLLIFDAKTERVSEIKIDMDRLKTAVGQSVLLEETKDMQIDIADVSPDGYQLDGPHYGGSGLLGGLFGGGYQNSGYRIKKGNVGYKIPHRESYYAYSQLVFVGWVLPK